MGVGTPPKKCRPAASTHALKPLVVTFSLHTAEPSLNVWLRHVTVSCICIGSSDAKRLLFKYTYLQNPTGTLGMGPRRTEPAWYGNAKKYASFTLRKRCVRTRSYSGLYFPTFGLNTQRYSVRMWENTDKKNSEYGHFLCSVIRME